MAQEQGCWGGSLGRALGGRRDRALCVPPSTALPATLRGELSGRPGPEDKATPARRGAASWTSPGPPTVERPHPPCPARVPETPPSLKPSCAASPPRSGTKPHKHGRVGRDQTQLRRQGVRSPVKSRGHWTRPLPGTCLLDARRPLEDGKQGVPQSLRRASSSPPTSARLRRVLCGARSSFLAAQSQRHGAGAEFLCSLLQDIGPMSLNNSSSVSYLNLQR